MSLERIIIIISSSSSSSSSISISSSIVCPFKFIIHFLGCVSVR
jgi:hypothetical protein